MEIIIFARRKLIIASAVEANAFSPHKHDTKITLDRYLSSKVTSFRCLCTYRERHTQTDNIMYVHNALSCVFVL